MKISPRVPEKSSLLIIVVLDITEATIDYDGYGRREDFVLKRFLIALCIVVFHALLDAWPKADAQGAPVQNGSVFDSEGPGPSTGPSAVIQGNDNPPNGSAAGAIQAIAADPSRPGTIYAGAVNGGIWKTTNGGTSWIPLIDQKASLSIASLTLDPTDPTHQTLVAGTGVTSNGAFASTSSPASATA